MLSNEAWNRVAIWDDEEVILLTDSAEAAFLLEKEALIAKVSFQISTTFNCTRYEPYYLACKIKPGFNPTFVFIVFASYRVNKTGANLS